MRVHEPDGRGLGRVEVTLHDRWFGLICAILAVPWTLIAFYLWAVPLEGGSDPYKRYVFYAVAGVLNVWALVGVLL